MNQLSPNPTEEMTEKPRTGIRWQFIVLGAGVILIVAAALFAILRNQGPAGEDEPQVIENIDLVETEIYSEAIVGQPLLVNPLLASSQADLDLVSLIFSGLTRLDNFGQPVPDLAEDWTVSSNGLTYTFHLREGTVWQDGQPFSADDVAFTIGLLQNSAFPGASDLAAFWRTVEVYADDAQTVRFELTQPLASFPEYAGIGILPAHLLAGVAVSDLAEDPFNMAPIGTGRLHWVSAEETEVAFVVHLEPNTDYYDRTHRITLDEVDLYFYDEAGDAFRALGHEVQALGGLTPSQLNAALGSRSLNVYTARLPLYAAVIFNQQDAERLPFFQDEVVRQALTAALDRDTLVTEVLHRSALIADSPVLPGTWAYNPDLQSIGYDTTAAAQLLTDAGWLLEGSTRFQEEVPMAFTLLVSDRDADQALGEAIVSQWRALGVNATLEVLSPAELVARLETPVEEAGRNFDAALVEFSQGRLADPDPYAFWHESQIEDGQNYSGLVDRDISEALEIARKDPNGVRRTELYQQFQAWFVERAAAILLFNPTYHYAVTCQIEGPQLMIFTNPSDRFQNMHEWEIAPPSEWTEVCPG